MSLLSLDSVCKCAQYSCYVHLGSKPEQKQVGGGVTPHTRWEGGWAVNTRHGTMCINMYIYIYTHMNMYMYMYMYIYLCMCICRLYMYIHAHAYVHVYFCMCICL